MMPHLLTARSPLRSASSKHNLGASTIPRYKLITIRPSYSIDTIKVLVGPYEEAFSVHKDIVCAKSPFFETACKKEWSEGKEGIVRLEQHRPDAFKLFVHWIYSSTIDLEIIPERIAAEVAYLVEAWALSDFLGCPDFCNRLVDFLLGSALSRSSMPHPNTVNKTPSGSIIRRLMVDLVAHRVSPGNFERAVPAWSQEVLVEVTKVFAHRFLRPNFDPRQQNKCYYHQHPEGTPKCT